MDIERIIAEILRGYSSADKTLERVLYSVLSKYNITPKNNEVSTLDHSWGNELMLFLERKQLAGCTVSTIEQYTYCLKYVLSVVNKPTNEITENDLYNYLIGYKRLNNVSDTTLLNVEKIIKAYFGWLHAKGIIPMNPAKGLDTIKCEKKIRSAFTDVEIEKLKDACKSSREIALVTFLCATGMRISECQRLNIVDVDFLNKRVIVYGKGRKEREVYLTDVAIMYLKKYLDERKDDSDALFVTARAPYKRMKVSGLQRLINEIGHRGGVCSYAHKFRITMATNLSKKGMPIEEVKEILGHSKLDTTMTYVNINKDRVIADYRKYA